MPDYKRKKVKRTLFRKKSHSEKKDIISSNIEMKNNSADDDEIKVIKGKKYRRKKVSKFLLAFIAIICILTSVLSIALPGGIYENLINFAARIGSGKYPVDISGSKVLDCVDNSSYYYVLTDTSVIAYSKNGKIIFNDLHGFSNPTLSVSSTRALVYDQGGKNAGIYNLSGKIHTFESDYEIITANMAQDGTVAFATYSDKFASVLNVYDKGLKHIYTWNSAKDIINNVLINKKGSLVAVSTIDVVAGQYKSKMNILSFDSADPLHTLDLNASIVLSLENTGKGISVICADKYKHVNWSKYTTKDILVTGEINSYRNTKNGLLLVLNLPNNRADNTIVLIDNFGEKDKEFKISSIITDIQYSKSRVYYISDTNVKILDKEGNILRSGNCNYGTEKFAVVSPNSIATICDRKIYKIDIQKGES